MFSRLVSSEPMFGNKMTACDETRFQVEPVISRLADFYAFILKVQNCNIKVTKSTVDRSSYNIVNVYEITFCRYFIFRLHLYKYSRIFNNQPLRYKS